MFFYCMHAVSCMERGRAVYDYCKLSVRPICLTIVTQVTLVPTCSVYDILVLECHII